MNAKTELLLLQMLWASGKALRPTYRKLDESFEAWTYRNGLQQQLQRLEERGLLEARPSDIDEARFHRLTEAGRITALGGRDPEASWAHEWDRKWRIFLFDIPVTQNSIRRKLTRSLATLGCGCLQGSVWIAPTRPPGINESLVEQCADCSHLLILEAESHGPEADRQMTQSAWDFEEINARYETVLTALERFPAKTAAKDPKALAAWATAENKVWLAAIKFDPLLPRALLPRNYLGRRAWRKRKSVLQRAGSLATQLKNTLPNS